MGVSQHLTLCIATPWDQAPAWLLLVACLELSPPHIYHPYLPPRFLGFFFLVYHLDFYPFLGLSLGGFFCLDSQAPLAAPAELRTEVSPTLAPREKPAAPAKTNQDVTSQERRGSLLRD